MPIDLSQFIYMKTLYESQGQRSRCFVDLLPKRLTIDRSYKATRFFNHHKTLFKEVNVVSPDIASTSHMKKLWKVKSGQWHSSKAELFEAISKQLELAVLNTWDPTATHVIMHSSGLDSRMLSWTIRRLYEELGDEWLGRVLFCCSKWEGPSFLEIMQYEGWDIHQYFIPGIVRKPESYYEPSLMDFKNAWRKADGCSPIGVNLFWYPVEEAIDIGLIPGGNRIQMYTGQWGNTVLDAGSGFGGAVGIKKQYERFYNSVLCQRPMYGDDVIHPYTSIDMAAVVSRSCIQLGKSLRPELVKYVDPKLASFTNMMADGDRHKRIADDIWAQILADYHSSWYGKKVAPNAKPDHRTTEFQTFWFHWTAASLCEYLREKGYNIS